jgi:hypothetical protein
LKIEIQTRDIQLMKFVFACRVVSYDQIARRHFVKTSETTARRRIFKLVKAGFLSASPLGLNNNVIRVVQPLPVSWSLICEKWPFELDSPHFKSESPEHDVRMAEVFMQFEKLGSFRSFFTENMLQSSSTLAEDPRFADLAKIQADGAMTIEDAHGEPRIYGVEYELSKKSPDGYRQKLIDYYLARGIDGVLYVSPKPEVQRLLAKIDEEIGQDREPRVWFCSEENALRGSLPITFNNRLEQSLEFK